MLNHSVENPRWIRPRSSPEVAYRQLVRLHTQLPDRGLPYRTQMLADNMQVILKKTPRTEAVTAMVNHIIERESFCVVGFSVSPQGVTNLSLPSSHIHIGRVPIEEALGRRATSYTQPHAPDIAGPLVRWLGTIMKTGIYREPPMLSFPRSLNPPSIGRLSYGDYPP